MFIDTYNKHGLAEQRNIFIKLINAQNNIPVIVSRCYHDLFLDDMQINASVDIGGLFVDGLGDGLFIYNNSVPIDKVNNLSFEILQSTRMFSLYCPSVES